MTRWLSPCWNEMKREMEKNISIQSLGLLIYYHSFLGMKSIVMRSKSLVKLFEISYLAPLGTCPNFLIFMFIVARVMRIHVLTEHFHQYFSSCLSHVCCLLLLSMHARNLLSQGRPDETSPFFPVSSKSMNFPWEL